MSDGRWTLVAITLAAITILGVSLSWKDRVPVLASAGGCACAKTSVPVTKYAVFWKEKDGYKASPTLFLTLESASAAIPRDAEEARIVPVRID